MNMIALVGWLKNPFELEADLFSTMDEFIKSSMKRESYFLMIINEAQEVQKIKLFLEKIFTTQVCQNIILVLRDVYKPIETLQLIHQYPIVAVVSLRELNRTEDLVNALLLTKRLTEQTETHQILLKEESENREIQYQQLVLELAEQHKKISEIQTRLVFNLQQEKVLHDTLLIIMTSHGIADIELRLQEILIPILGNLHLRILLHSGSVHPLAWVAPAMGFELYEEEKIIGQLIITPLEKQNFSKRDLKMIENISEAIALHIPRFLSYEANMAIELEWRATFDAISDPLIVVSDSYLIIDANKAAKNRMPQGELKSAPCFQLLFNRSSPCEFCRFGKKANVESRSHFAGELWEMNSHELNRKEPLWNDKKQKLFIHLYRNKFDQNEMEEKLKDFSKAAEVGIFKASLAHELNNPVGGLLTLAQLQKMELNPNDPLFPLIQEIEKQAFACRDLIQDLLHKTRNKGADI